MFLAQMQVKTGDQNLVTDRVLPLMQATKGNGEISDLLELAQSDSMVEFTRLLQTALSKKHCAQMNFDQFLQFCKGYDLFPGLCSAAGLKQIFAHTCSED